MQRPVCTLSSPSYPLAVYLSFCLVRTQRGSLSQIFDKTVGSRSSSGSGSSSLRLTARESLPWCGSPQTQAREVSSEGTDGSLFGSDGAMGEHATTNGDRAEGEDSDTALADAALGAKRPKWSLSLNTPREDTPVIPWSSFHSLKYLGEGEFATVHSDVSKA